MLHKSGLAPAPVPDIARKPGSLQPTGYLMSRAGRLMLFAFLLLAAWNHQPVIAVLLGFTLGAAGLADAWSRMSLAGVTCQRTVSEHRLFPGDYLELKLSVANRKVLPLPWIQVDNEIPLGLADGVSLIASRPGFALLTHSTALMWYTSATWRQRLCAGKRGYYPLGDITVTSGDIFGFYPRSATRSQPDDIIVYPRLYDIAEPGIASLYPLGDTVTDRRIFEDPTRAIGVRDYTPRDSLRYIHWKASARHQNLQVKVFEPTTTLKVAVILAVDTFWHDGAVSEADLELGISTAASVARHLIERRSSAGLLVNSRQADSRQPVRILPAGGAAHLIGILEALAKVTVSPSSPFVAFLQAERGDLPMGTTLVFILGSIPQTVSALLTSLKHAGYKLLVLQVGGGAQAGTDPDIPCRQVRPDGHLADLSAVANQ